MTFDPETFRILDEPKSTGCTHARFGDEENCFCDQERIARGDFEIMDYPWSRRPEYLPAVAEAYATAIEHALVIYGATKVVLSFIGTSGSVIAAQTAAELKRRGVPTGMLFCAKAEDAGNSHRSDDRYTFNEEDEVEGKVIYAFVDDFISTGKTLVKVNERVVAQQARSVPRGDVNGLDVICAGYGWGYLNEKRKREIMQQRKGAPIFVFTNR